jgi:hypothetical protein
MTFRNHTPTLLTLAMLTACAPAHADAFPDSLPSDPARPGWRPPATRPHVPGAGVDYDFDPGRGPLLDAHAEDNLWLVSPGTWGAGASAVQVSTGPVVTQRPCVGVPVPLPIAGAAAAWGWARRLRRRVG